VHLNPCGYAVDFARRPYTTKARVHNDPAAPLVDLVWYRTDLPFLTTESVINSRDWDSDPYLELRVGEVPTWSDPRAYNGNWNQLPGAQGGHICNAEWFNNGEPWPVTLPNQVYSPDGVPLGCCVQVYAIHADQVWVCNAVPANPCSIWSHIEPGPGNDWAILAPWLPGATVWRVRRTGPFIGQFAEFRPLVPWDGRGTSPQMPFFAGTPIPGVPAITLQQLAP